MVAAALVAARKLREVQVPQRRRRQARLGHHDQRVSWRVTRLRSRDQFRARARGRVERARLREDERFRSGDAARVGGEPRGARARVQQEAVEIELVRDFPARPVACHVRLDVVDVAAARQVFAGLERAGELHDRRGQDLLGAVGPAAHENDERAREVRADVDEAVVAGFEARLPRVQLDPRVDALVVGSSYKNHGGHLRRWRSGTRLFADAAPVRSPSCRRTVPGRSSRRTWSRSPG